MAGLVSSVMNYEVKHHNAMNIEEENSSMPQGGDGTQPGGSASNLHERVEALTPLEQDRYFSIHYLYKEGAFDVLKYFKGKRTPNQWTTFLTNVKLVNNDDDANREYYLALKQELPLGQPLRVFDLATKVKVIRVRHNLPDLETLTFKLSLAELSKVYLVEETEGLNLDGKSKHALYTPVFSILITH